MSEEKEQKKGRLKTRLIILLSFICFFTILSIYMVISFSKIENIIDRIRNNGGSVQTRSVLPNWSNKISPGWMSKKFQRPYAVWLPPEFGDKELIELLEVKGLSSLTATGTRVTEKSFIPITEYKGLQLLYLSRNSFSIEKLLWLEKQMPATTIIY